MQFTHEPVYILTVLLLLLAFSEWLAKKPFFVHIGSVLLVIISTAVVANLGLIPSSQGPTVIYDGIFQYAAPLGIFFLLLEVKLRALKFAGLPMILMFLVGAAATTMAALIGYKLLSPQDNIPLAHAVAGMYTGTYTGGSANLNAVALNYGVNNDGVLYAAVNAVDNIITAVWMMLTIAIPRVLQRYLPREKALPPQTHQEINDPEAVKESKIILSDIALLLALGLGSMFVASSVSAALGWMPSIVVLTTIALVFAQMPFVQRLQGGRTMGYLLLMLFLAVIGAYCDLGALANSGNIAGTLFIWVSLIVLLHGLIIFGVGGLFKQDWDLIAVASNANIGGSISAPVCAASLGRPDLELPGLLAGTIGTAIGTYLGIAVAAMLK